jgi:hypothetical protein
MKEEKQLYLLFLVGILLMAALYLINHSNTPDFFKGLIFGVGIGLIVSFIIRKMRSGTQALSSSLKS